MDVPVCRYLAGWDREDDLALVAKDAGDSRKVGVVRYRLFTWTSRFRGCLHAGEIAIAVAPDWRGTGSEGP